MKTFRLVCMLTAILVALSSPTSQPEDREPSQRSLTSAADFTLVDHGSRARLRESYGRLPLSFEPNEGQAGRDVKFLSRGRGYQLSLKAAEAEFQLWNEKAGSHAGRLGEGALRSSIVRMKLFNANPEPQIAGHDELPGRSHYYIGNDPGEWRTNVLSYAKVEYEQVWPGIDLVYYGNQRQLEYDFIIAPGADPKMISLAFEGADEVKLDSTGNLVLHIAGGEVVMHKPFVYQEVNGARSEVAGRYQLKNGKVSFLLGEYNTSEPLVIDPVLVYSTYLGPATPDHADGIAVDQAGNVYLTGNSNFPNEFNNAYIAKLNAAGTALVYSTSLIGSGNEFGSAIAVDATGNAYVTGSTSSADFPVLNAFQGSRRGVTDAFVAKVNANGTLVYSTYLGGSEPGTSLETMGLDFGNAIGVDAAGQVFVAGRTYSINFPVLNSLQSFGNGTVYPGAGFSDGFVSKLNASGNGLLYSTYIGGNGDDSCEGIAVDSSGNVWVTGWTRGADNPVINTFRTTPGAFQTQPNQGFFQDGFVVRLNAAGIALVYSTFLGGSGTDTLTGIAVDGDGNAYVTGATNSADYPLESPHQSAPQIVDVVVTRLNASGSALIYSTLLGGSQTDIGIDITIDAAGNAYVTGSTTSSDFPAINAIFPNFGGSSDAFIAKINTRSKTVAYSTYLGGSGTDSGHGIAVDAPSSVYVTGQTSSINFPTKDPLQATLNGLSDVFVAKISDAVACFALSAQADKLVLSNVMPADGEVVSGAILKLGGLRATVTWLLQSADDAILDVTLFDQAGNIRYDFGTIPVRKPTQCPPPESSQEIVMNPARLDLAPIDGVEVTGLKLTARLISTGGAIIKRADVNYPVKPDEISITGGSEKINGQTAPNGTVLFPSDTITFDGELVYQLTSDLAGQIRVRAINANGGAVLATKFFGPVTATPGTDRLGVNIQFNVPAEVADFSIVAQLLDENQAVLKTASPVVYRISRLQIELGIADSGRFGFLRSGDVLFGGSTVFDALKSALAIKVKNELPANLRDAKAIVLLTQRLNSGVLKRGPLGVRSNLLSEEKFPRPAFLLWINDLVPDDVDKWEFQLVLLPPNNAAPILSNTVSIRISRISILSTNPPTDRKLRAGLEQEFVYNTSYNSTGDGVIKAEAEFILKGGRKRLQDLTFPNGAKPAGASSNSEQFKFTLNLPPDLFVLKVTFRIEGALSGITVILSKPKIYINIEPLPLTIPAGAKQTFQGLGVDVTTIENGVNRLVNSARKAGDMKNAALEGVGLLKFNLRPSFAESRALTETTAERLAPQSLLGDFVGINATWLFDPLIPADGSFIADLTFSYDADDLPDDPNFNEAAMKVISFDPATGQLGSYPTTIDLNAKTATVRVNGLMPMYSLGHFGPFGHRTQNFPVLRSLDDFTTQLHFASFGSVNAGLSVRAYTPVGQAYSGTGIVNPMTTILPAGRTLSGAVSEFFNFTEPLDGGWIQAQADKNFIAGYQMLGKDTRLDGLSLPAPVAGTQVLTSAEYDATVTTEIHIVNVTRFAANLTLELRDSTGALVGGYETSLQPKQTFAYRLQDIFSAVTQPFTGYVIVRGDQDLSAVVLQISGDELVALNGQAAPAGNTATRLYAPYVVIDNEIIATRLSLVNPTSATANLTLRLVGETGANLAQPVNMQLGAGQQLRRDVTQIFSLNSAEAAYGAIIVESSISGVVGDISLRDPSGFFSFHTALSLSGEPSRNFVLPWLDNREDSFTDISIFNPQTQAANVTLRVFKPDGGLTGAAAIIVPPGGFFGNLVDSIVTESFGQEGGYVTISSDQPLVADAIFGKLNGKMFAALEALAYDPAEFTRSNTTVSAASYLAAQLAAESIAAVFGAELATSIEAASELPLPTVLTGTTVRVRDSAGADRLSPLFFVAPQQVNYQLPPGTANGLAHVTVTGGNGAISTGTVNITAVAPGLFTANASGLGLPAATLLRLKADGTQSFEPLAQFDPAQNRFIAVPIDLGPESDQLFLILFGTGWRFRSDLPAVKCTIGGINSEVLYAGEQGGFVGLDQMNVRLPRSLAGHGEVDLIITVDGITANPVKINVQ